VRDRIADTFCNETEFEIAQNQRFSANSGANSVSLPKFAVEWGSFTTAAWSRQSLIGSD
jgi:hypothetical protein